MRKTFQVSRLTWLAPFLATCLLGLGAGRAIADESDTGSAVSLRAKYAELDRQLSHNPFKRPLYVVSVESPRQLKADIYALVDYPIAAVNAALTEPAHWCDVLILHLNTKYCRATTKLTNTVIAVDIGKKNFQQVDDAHRVEFAYRVASTTPEYFHVGLNAPTGPLGTSDYRIKLEAAAVQNGKTFLHLTYSYAYNLAGRLAMQGYLATLGSGKVGFTNLGTPPNGQPEYIGGVRGVVERNTMRYYLATDAYLGALAVPLSERFEKRLKNWFDATELYPRQLHEIDRASYLDMKRREYLRMQNSP